MDRGWTNGLSALRGTYWSGEITGPISHAVRRLLWRGKWHPAFGFQQGAAPCMGLLSVEEFLEPLRDLDIRESVQ